MNVVRKLPRFSDLPPEQRTPEAVEAAFADPPVIYMTLEDLTAEAQHLRGIYETSMPTINVLPALANANPQSNRHRWLDGQPDWRKSFRKAPSRCLAEVTPIEVEGGFLNYRWEVRVIGEEEAYAQHVATTIARFALTRRLERAG